MDNPISVTCKMCGEEAWEHPSGRIICYKCGRVENKCVCRLADKVMEVVGELSEDQYFNLLVDLEMGEGIRRRVIQKIYQKDKVELKEILEEFGDLEQEALHEALEEMKKYPGLQSKTEINDFFLNEFNPYEHGKMLRRLFSRISEEEIAWEWVETKQGSYGQVYYYSNKLGKCVILGTDRNYRGWSFDEIVEDIGEYREEVEEMEARIKPE